MQQGNLQRGEKEKKTGGKEATDNETKLQQEKRLARNDSDTEPDEFIAPNADTDTPLEGKGIVNDAVLGGEDHKNIDPGDKTRNKK